MMEANTSRQKSVCKTEGPELSIVRVGKASDVPELLRLFSARQAEAGDLAEVDARKVMEAFEAAISNRRSMVMVAPGADGRLTGFVLFGLVERWWSAAPAISELCLCLIKAMHVRGACASCGNLLVGRAGRVSQANPSTRLPKHPSHPRSKIAARRRRRQTRRQISENVFRAIWAA
jgi:hypothetical protein